MENDLWALLTADVTLAALVTGTDGKIRIYPDDYAQGAASPCVRYSNISGAAGAHMQASDGLTIEEVQIDIRALTAASRLAVRGAVIARLDCFSGVQGDTEFRLIKHLSKLSRFEKTDAEAFYTDALRFEVISRVAV